MLHDLVFEEVLDFLDGDGMARLGAGVGDVLGRIGDLTVGQTLRNGSEVEFDISKIENAITAANAEVPASAQASATFWDA